MSLPGLQTIQAVGPGIGWDMPAAVAGALLGLSIVIYILIRILTHRHEGHGPEHGDKKTMPPGGKPKPPRPQS